MIKKLFGVLLLIGVIFSFEVYQKGAPLRELEITVHIQAGNSLGSGFIIGPNYILTNKHVVGSSKFIDISDYQGKKQKAEVVYSHPLFDVVVLRTSNINRNQASLYCREPIFGQDVNVVGRTEYISWGITPMVVSSNMFKMPDPLEELQSQFTLGPNRLVLNGQISFGASGSPVFIKDSTVVIGMVTYLMKSMVDKSHLNFTAAISSQDLCSWLDANKVEYNRYNLPTTLDILGYFGYNNGITNNTKEMMK